MKSIPLPWQEIGIERIHRKFNGRALLADDMGLGKTFQTLGYMDRYLKRGPIVVICPAILKWHWEEEARTHIGKRSTILEKRVPQKRWYRANRHNKDAMYIINFEILGRPLSKDSWAHILIKLKPRLVIVDECQRIKNRNAICTKAVRAICEVSKRVIAISGTPIINRPIEFFPVLNILVPEVFPSFFSFGMRYCEGRRTPWGWEFKGCDRLDELYSLLKKHCMIRRLKKHVMKDLPTKTRSVFPIGLTFGQQSEYMKAQNDFRNWLIHKFRKRSDRSLSAERLVKMGYLKRLSAELKMPKVIDWIERYFNDNPKSKLLVFGIHRAALDTLQKHFEKKMHVVRIDGRTPKADRKIIVKKFNGNKKYKLFLGNIQAAGYGWSCKSTSTIAFVELDWTPGAHNQAEDRIHGLGRGVKGAKALIYYLIARDTIEESLCNVLQKKQRILDETLDGKVMKGSLNILDILEKKLRRKGRFGRANVSKAEAS